LHCPHLIEPRWIEWLRRFACFSQHTLQLWPHFVVVRGIVHRAPQRLCWAPHNFVGAWLDHSPMLALVALRNNLVVLEFIRTVAHSFVVHLLLAPRRILPL
jgi:hypothetical protein